MAGIWGRGWGWGIEFDTCHDRKEAVVLISLNVPCCAYSSMYLIAVDNDLYRKKKEHPPK